MKKLQICVQFVFWLAACAMTSGGIGTVANAAEGLPAGEAGVARMEAARAEVENVRSNIFLTLVELDRVRGEQDPAHPKFQAFTNQLARMQVLAKAFATRAQEMKERGAKYFADWEAATASIQDPTARAAAEQRYGERKAAYDAINRFMQEGRKAFLPFLEELNTIKDILQGPRDAASIAKAKDLFMRANWHCIDTQRALMEIEDELDRLAATFRPGS